MLSGQHHPLAITNLKTVLFLFSFLFNVTYVSPKKKFTSNARVKHLSKAASGRANASDHNMHVSSHI